MTPIKVKDYFSGQASLYAAFRPTYPPELYDFIFRHLENHNLAWDCATGNGQVARALANHFEHVYATDISQQQLDAAVKKENIIYSLASAEKTNFKNDQFDLVTVGQALHWFERVQFYEEVNRVAKSGALVAAWGYGRLYIEPDIDAVVDNFYSNTVGPYWDTARRLVEQEYKQISFPFMEIASPKFYISAEWTPDHLAGYLESWSATQKYIKQHQRSPVPDVIKALSGLWRDGEIKMVQFPVFLKLGRVA